ncbi:MAG: cytochrome c biogenesis protein CcdA [Clostridium sp.]|nr:cytochrome c biogenesis protein CcdA [Clostridium sp.]
MEYLIVFIEGIITFISPCILPMLPIYISYFAGDIEEGKKGKTIINAIGFVIGFTIIFTLLGALAGTFGMFIKKYQTIFNIIGGSILIIFGLNYMGILSIGFIEKTKKIQVDIKSFKFFSTIVFGMIFAIGWTPCVGTFLGSALMIAASSSGVLKGTIMLLVYSLGLGIPFIIAALIMDELKNSMKFIKKNYKLINRISGVFLIIVGISMIIGLFNKLLSILTI